MKFNLLTLFVLTTFAACALTLVAWSSWFLEIRNTEVTRRLQEPVRLSFKRGTVAEFATYLRVAHGIPTSLSPEVGDQVIDVETRRPNFKHEIRLKNAVGFALRCGDAPLSYTILDGRLHLVLLTEEDFDCIFRTETYTSKDLVAPRMIFRTTPEGGSSGHEGGVF